MEGESVPEESRQLALDVAKEVQSGLDHDSPSFIKSMRRSHVSGGFWLGLPCLFCKKYLPAEDTAMNLVDEDLDASHTMYLAAKNGLSAGWRGFSIAHGLVDGDALVFHLVNSTTFKVYIIRMKKLSKQMNGKTSFVITTKKSSEKRSKTTEFKQGKRNLMVSSKKNSLKRSKAVELTQKTNARNHASTSECAKKQQTLKPMQSTRASQRRCTKNPMQESENKKSLSTDSATSESIEWSAYDPSDMTLPSSSSTTLSSLQDSELLDITREGANCEGKRIAANSKEKVKGNEDPSAGQEGVCRQCFRLKCELGRRVEEAESILKENIELRYLRTCKVCMDVDVSMLLMPCKHVCLCKECEPKLDFCPICNVAKISSVEVFMS